MQTLESKKSLQGVSNSILYAKSNVSLRDFFNPHFQSLWIHFCRFGIDDAGYRFI